MGKTMKIFVTLVDAYHRVIQPTWLLIIKSQDDSFCEPVSLFLYPPLSLPNGLMKKLAMVAGMKGIHGLNKMNFNSSRLIRLWQLLNDQSASSRDRHCALDMAAFPVVISQLPVGRLITLDCYHRRKGSILSLLE